MSCAETALHATVAAQRNRRRPLPPAGRHTRFWHGQTAARAALIDVSLRQSGWAEQGGRGEQAQRACPSRVPPDQKLGGGN